MKYLGSEQIIINGRRTRNTVLDFWRYSCSDLTGQLQKFAHYLVASSVEAPPTEQRILTDSGVRVEVRAASYVSSADDTRPDQVSFDIAPPLFPKPTGDFVSGTKRNCDAYIFCLYKGMDQSQNILDLDFWEFYAVSAETLEHERPGRISITLPSLMDLSVWQSDYYGIPEAVEKALAA